MEKPYSKQGFEDALEAFRKQTEILARLTESLTGCSDRILQAVGPIAVAAEGSCRSVLILTERDQIRDALVTARTALLSIINACFILAEGSIAAERAYRHAMQKAIRDLRREIRTKDLTILLSWSNSHDVERIKDSIPGIRDWLSEFERKNGKERIQWTQESTNEQIEKVTEKYGKEVGAYLQMGVAVIYRHASEIAHGTLFGELWYLGFLSPGEFPHTREDLNLGPRNKATAVLAALSFCVLSVIRVLSQEFSGLRELSA